MFLFRTCGVLLIEFLFAGLSGAATSEQVDFQRDVQPLIEKHCILCHGPEQQMNSFRLDRKSAALRGGTRTVIVPGNSAASRLYLRLVSDKFGKRRPATGPLQPAEIQIFKAWIDQGAPWPENLANEVVTSPPDPRALQMVDALRTGGSADFLKLVEHDPQALNVRGPGGATPFMFAALYADSGTVKHLLQLGGDANRKSDAGATALMWAATDLGKTRVLLEHGAEVNAVSNDGRTALVIASIQAGNAAVVQALLEHGASPDLKGKIRTTSSALHEAAAAGDIQSMHLLITHGADMKAAGSGALAAALENHCSKCLDLISATLNPKAYTSALLSVSVNGDVNAVKYLLDHGADVNAADGDGRTALMYASNNDRLPLEMVKLLIERGANVNAKNAEGGTALDVARLHGEGSPIVAALAKAGAQSTLPDAPILKTRKENTVSAAVQKALPLIQNADLSFSRKSGCVSCHNEALTDMAISTARTSGFRVDEPLAQQEVKGVINFFGEWRERMLQGLAPGGPAYMLGGLHAEGYKPDLLTDAIARYLRMHQFADGHWGVGCGGSRNPLCGDPITTTANSMHALQFYAPVPSQADYGESIQRAANWLEKAPVYTNEDRTFRVFGLIWAKRDGNALTEAKHDLLSTQRADGGWSDNPYMPSTAYATGEAMVALHEAGLSADESAWRRGVQFLLKTQGPDGAWYVRSHSYGTQPYFDNGFPYGKDQWISAAGTNWATMALALSAGHNQKRVVSSELR